MLMWSLLGLLWIHRRYEHKNIIHLFKFQFQSVYFKMQNNFYSFPLFFSFFISMMSIIYCLTDPQRLSESHLLWNNQVNVWEIDYHFPDGKVIEMRPIYSCYPVLQPQGRIELGHLPTSCLQERQQLTAPAGFGTQPIYRLQPRCSDR